MRVKLNVSKPVIFSTARYVSLIYVSLYIFTEHVNVEDTWALYLSSTHPCIPPGSLNLVPASAGVKAGKSPLLCDPIWHVISSSGEVISITNCYIRVYFTLL